MEYTDGQVEMRIKDNIYRAAKMVKDTADGQPGMNITVSGKTQFDGEKEYPKRRDKFSKTYTKKTSA